MVLPILAFALQVAYPIADQAWKVEVGMTGSIDTPELPNIIENLLVKAELSFAKSKTDKPNVAPFTLSLKVKKNQTPLIEAFTSGIEESKIGPKSDKDYLYVTEPFWINQENLSVDLGESDGNDILNPFAIGVAVMWRTMSSPELKKEYLLIADGDRKFFGVFNINLNPNLDPAKGEIAYRFNIVLKENGKEYPNFFLGTVRANTKTKRIDYIRASSNLADGPIDPNDGPLKDVKSFAFNLTSK